MFAALLDFLFPLFHLVAVVNRKKSRSPTRNGGGPTGALSNAIRYVSTLSFFRYAEDYPRSMVSLVSGLSSPGRRIPERDKFSVSGGEDGKAGDPSVPSQFNYYTSLAGHNVEGLDANLDKSNVDLINHTAEDVFAFQPLFEDSAERGAVVVDAGAAGSELDERAPAGSHLSHKPVSFQSNGMLSEKFAFMPSLFSPMQSSTVAPSYGQEVVEDV